MKLFKILIISLLLFSCVSFDARATTYATYDRGTSYPLHGACGDNNFSAVKTLVESGEYDINGYDTTTSSTFAQTPLHVAAFYSDENTIRYLLDHGADPNKPAIGYSESSPLHNLTLRKSYMIPEIVEKYGGKLNNTDNDGNTVFHYAAFWGRDELCQYCLDAMNEIPQNNEGETPLHWALEMDSLSFSLKKHTTIMLLSDNMNIDRKALSLAFGNIFNTDIPLDYRLLSVWTIFLLLIKAYPFVFLILFVGITIFAFLLVRKLVRKILSAKRA